MRKVLLLSDLARLYTYFCSCIVLGVFLELILQVLRRREREAFFLFSFFTEELDVCRVQIMLMQSMSLSHFKCNLSSCTVLRFQNVRRQCKLQMLKTICC